MTDERRFTELPSYSRMAWSSRPVWNRRPPVGEHRDPRSNLGVAPRHRTRDGYRGSPVERVHAVARSQSLVANGARAIERTYE